MINNTNHIYRDNCNFVKELKNKWNRMNDPILQRNEMYVVRDKGVQQCKVNYLERMKQKEKNNNNKHNIKTNTKYNNSTVFSEGNNNNNIKYHNKRLFTPECNFQCKLITKPSKHYNPQRSTIFSTANINTQCNNTSKHIIQYQPSQEYIKFNDKKSMLTSTRKINKNKQPQCTKDRIFGISRIESAPKMKYVHKLNLKLQTDHINDIISYKYGPTFKEEKYPDKPTHTDFNSVVSHNKNNIKDNYMYI